MTKRYTKGPWESAGLMIYAGGEDGANICEVSSPRTSSYVEHRRCQLDDPDWDEAVANMRLIRTAPELLEACRFALDHLTGAPGGEVSPSYLANVLLQVIEKAEKGND